MKTRKLYRGEFWEVFVPADDENGREIPVAVHQEWDNKVAEQFGGLTVMRTKNRGVWSTAEAVVREPMIAVRVLILPDYDPAWEPEAAKDNIGEKLLALVDLIKTHYRQKAVMLWRVSKEAIVA